MAEYRALSKELEKYEYLVYGFHMLVTLPLNEMTLEEKLQTMEALWEDLSHHAENIESPEWHREILQGRQQQIESGQAKFVDWEQAKADIRKRVS